MREDLEKAERIAAQLFDRAVSQGIITAGRTEKQINTDLFELAEKEFGIKKYWHKRIVRAGKNTLQPYAENPPNLILKDDEIVFLDFGPILEEYEADYGRTYVLGSNPSKVKITRDAEQLWHTANNAFRDNPYLTGAQLYAYCTEQAKTMGWEFGGPIAGHLIGQFPHEKLDGEDMINYIHPDNTIPLNKCDTAGQPRYWIIEIHLVDRAKEIGAFFEQLAG